MVTRKEREKWIKAFRAKYHIIPKPRRPWSRENIIALHKIVKYKPETGRWKYVVLAQETFGVDRKTIRAILADHPTPPSPWTKKPILPKEVKEFNDTECWKKIKGKQYEREMRHACFEGWKAVGKIDPYTWTKQHVIALRDDQFIDKRPNSLWIGITKKIAPEQATNLRRAFERMDRDDLLKHLKRIPKRPAGTRLDWYLDNSEIERVIEHIDRLDVLIYVRIALECGGRPISLAGKTGVFYGKREYRLTRDKVNQRKHYIKRWESKKRDWVFAQFCDETLAMVERYVSDMRIKPLGDLFPRNQDYYSNQLKRVGARAQIAKLMKKGAGAYILRHTFATQANEHGVSLETVMYQGGWKDAKTVVAYYLKVTDKKVAFEIRGAKVKLPHFNEWVRQFHTLWERQYRAIKATL